MSNENKTSIKVKSIEGIGSTFSFDIPFYDNDSENSIKAFPGRKAARKDTTGMSFSPLRQSTEYWLDPINENELIEDNKKIEKIASLVS